MNSRSMKRPDVFRVVLVKVVMFCGRIMHSELQACERTDYGIVNRYDYNDYNTHALLYNESTVRRFI